jgi:hypothetical protein
MEALRHNGFSARFQFCRNYLGKIAAMRLRKGSVALDENYVTH